VKETSTFLSLVLTGDILAVPFGWLEVVCESRRVGVARLNSSMGRRDRAISWISGRILPISEEKKQV
jgi:hypothetical protein